MIICDLAEYYHIYNYENYDPLYIATLVRGLGGYSRLMRELAGNKYTEQERLTAKICDNLSVLIWQNTPDGHHGRNFPHMILDDMLGINDEKEYSHEVFDSIEEFFEARKKALYGDLNG